MFRNKGDLNKKVSIELNGDQLLKLHLILTGELRMTCDSITQMYEDGKTAEDIDIKNAEARIEYLKKIYEKIHTGLLHCGFINLKNYWQ